VLDGDLSDPVWRSARRVVVATNQGANFDGTGTSAVEIRAVHDGETAYFAFVWDDPTRSLKHLPLIKKADGWYVLQGEYDIGDEHEHHEDKLAVLLTRDDALLAGDRTFHAGRAPVDGKPATFSGRGLHYTTDGSIVDVWQWKATRGGLLGRIDDGHFGPPAEPSTDEVEGRSPYKGGFAADSGTAGYTENFEPRAPGGYQRPVQPKRLPKDWHATWSAMGRVDIDPNVGESDGARWWMTEAESLHYTPELDTQFPVGALIPGVIILEEHTGDRADIRGAARWAAGRWALEVARRLDTGSPYDVPIATGIFMRLAAFDRSQIRHTRHIRPIRLEVQ
jgi:Ethylbenzene dehydrogenase